MTSEELLNEALLVINNPDVLESIHGRTFIKRVELYLSGKASEAEKLLKRDFDIREIRIPAYLHGDDELLIRLVKSYCQGALDPEPSADLGIMDRTTEYTLIGIPLKSLKKMAKFILEIVSDYEEQFLTDTEESK